MSRYKISNPKIEGHIEAVYEDEKLQSLHFFLNAPLSYVQWTKLLTFISQDEGKLVPSPLTVEKLAVSKTNEKIALFCRMYAKYVGVSYAVSAADSGKMKLIAITEELLKRYFESQNFLFKGKHSISNLTKYYNELRAEIVTPTGNNFPNHYSPDFEKKLSAKDQEKYWEHLRSKGLKAVKNGTNKVVDWK